MARFQAQTNAVLEQELEALREQLGLRPDQKADLLREVTALASWVIQQASAGRQIEARGHGEVQPLVNPTVARLQRASEARAATMARLALTHAEVVRLAELLDRGFEPTPGLMEALQRLSNPDRRPPTLKWRT